jgi:hypothetical protein
MVSTDKATSEIINAKRAMASLNPGPRFEEGPSAAIIPCHMFLFSFNRYVGLFKSAVCVCEVITTSIEIFNRNDPAVKREADALGGPVSGSCNV